MKKITLLIILLIASLGFSQEVIQNFEAAGAVNGDPFGGMAVPSVIAGPGSNATQVLEIVGNINGEVWQGINLNLTENVELTSTKTMSIDVYSVTPITFLVKVNGGLAGAPEAAAEVTHDGNSTWQTLDFTFNTALDGKAATANGIYTSFVIHAYWAAGATTFGNVTKDSRTFYVDNIVGIAAVDLCNNGIQDGDETGIDCGGSCSPCLSPPTVAAPTPPVRDPANVISIYSDAYTDINIDNFDFGLCSNSPAVEENTIAGNLTQRYLGPGCQGIDIQNNRIDASTFTNLHFDFYTDESLVGAVFNIKLVDWAGNPTQAGSTGLEIIFNGGTNPALVTNQWVSVDVDITSLGGMVLGNLTRSDIAQIHITSNLTSAWYDNLYLYKDPGTCSDGIQNQGETGLDCGGPNCAPCTGPPTLAAPTPPTRSAADVISVYSDAYSDITTDNFDFGLCGNNPAVAEVMIAGNATQQYFGPGCQGINFQNNRQDASAFTHLHIDFYTDEADLVGKVFNLKLVDWAGNPTESGSTGLEVIFNGGTSPALVANEWVSIDVDITSLGGMVLGNLTRSDVAQLHITSNLTNAWYDNLYLHKGTTLSTKDVKIADLKVYPNPTQDSWTVKTRDANISSIKVFDMLGKNVLSLKPNTNDDVTIDGTSLKSGLYFARIESKSGTSTLKLVKE